MPTYLDRLSPVVERLLRESPDFPWDTLGLARLIASFMQFSEDVAGKNVRLDMSPLLNACLSSL